MNRISKRLVLVTALCFSLVVTSLGMAAPATKTAVAGDLVELMAPTPAWFTPELQELVKANGVAAAPADAPLPGEVGIRPGSWMLSPNWCTMNYVFQNGSRLGIGTAGHCAKNGDNVVLLTVAP
ncbi:MAG: hypothetical protein ABIS18_02895, partial [Actinomycetota bacterium]